MWAQISLSAPGRYFMGLSRNMEASEPAYGRSRAGKWSLVSVHMDGHGRLRGRVGINRLNCLMLTLSRFDFAPIVPAQVSMVTY